MTSTPVETPAPAGTPDPLDALVAPLELDEPAPETDPRIKAFVDNGLKRTEAQPRKWFYVVLPEAEVKRVAREAKRYARGNGMTFRVRNTGDPARLVYRVTVKTVTENG